VVHYMLFSSVVYTRDGLPQEGEMVTTEQIYEYLERLVAEGKLSGDRYGMRDIQTAAGILMNAATANGDKETAKRFHFLAARAANKHEELTGNE
jgi:hypothetical protein